MAQKYQDIEVTTTGGIRWIKWNRPKSLNAFGGQLIPETAQALRDADADPNVVFTVLTGEGRFLSSGADVRQVGSRRTDAPAADAHVQAQKTFQVGGFSTSLELMRLLVDHKKVLIVAMNGPAVGAGAAWFIGVADLVFASDSAWLQIPFSSLGLVPEGGSAVTFAQSLGVRRATEVLMFGTKLDAATMEKWGLVNRVFPTANFHAAVGAYLEQQLNDNDPTSLLETKRLVTEPLRESRMQAAYRSVDALAEMFAKGIPVSRFVKKAAELAAKSAAKKGGAKI
ncbi:ClpP/crotonase [Gonapodya prolifera JEL478]|uniref:ClpP/crotonase n=1 Tax=Gonapodya prolifera (strain JEL478) TaxID=1344416 RepID=A0A139B0L4_GONPJ|nr:ClpP/crotonase [Gonapodya prolifera JEL478]|eukprot:KXS22480.1 ClpP/crotonase [Gonapodya prolifera JEL478]